MHGLPLVLALAAGPAVELTWAGDPGCTQAAYRASLDSLLAGVEAGDPLQVTVLVHRSPRGRWTLDLTLDDQGERSKRLLRGPSCASVSEAAAFVTSVIVGPGAVDRMPAPAAIDEPAEPAPGPAAEAPLAEDGSVPTPPMPEAPASASDPPPAPAITSDPPPAPVVVPSTPLAPPRAAAPRTPEAPASRGARGFVRVAGGFEALGMPSIGGQLHGAAGPMGRHWRVELRGLFRFPRLLDAPGDISGAATRIGMWAAGASACGVVRPSVLEIPLCGGFEVGQAFGSAQGIADPKRDRIPWAAATMGVAVAWAPRRWLALWLGFELAVPLLRGSFGIAGLGAVHEIAPVSPRGAFGLEFRLP